MIELATKKTIGDRYNFAEVSSLGAMVERYVVGGKRVLYNMKSVGDKTRGGIPICFPFFGSPPEGFRDIPQHGWLRHQQLEIKEKRSREIVFVGKNMPSDAYPWQLDYEITVLINMQSSLLLKVVTTRLSDGERYDAPFNPGFHPYFLSDPSKFHISRGMARVGSKVV